MRSSTVPNEAELLERFEKEKAEGLTIFRKSDFVGRKADLADRATQLETLCEQANEARLHALQVQRTKLESEREEKRAAEIRFEPELARLREIAERGLSEFRAAAAKHDEMRSLVPQLEQQIDRIRSLEIAASESAPEIDWLDIHIQDLAKQALASQDRDGRYRVHVGAVTITTNNSAPAEALEQLHKTYPDKRGVILKALSAR